MPRLVHMKRKADILAIARGHSELAGELEIRARWYWWRRGRRRKLLALAHTERAIAAALRNVIGEGIAAEPVRGRR